MANTQINISTNGKTTLATAGKYCDRNIDVNVSVAGGGSGGNGSGFWDETTVKNFIEGKTATITFPDGLTKIKTHAFYSCVFAQESLSIPEGITNINAQAFQSALGFTTLILPSTLSYIGNYAFQSCITLDSVTFKSNPSGMNGGTFNGCSGIKTINVPWAEGEVDYAPWGATNATINYNYTGE